TTHGLKIITSETLDHRETTEKFLPKYSRVHPGQKQTRLPRQFGKSVANNLSWFSPWPRVSVVNGFPPHCGVKMKRKKRREMYPEILVVPMREELTRLGVEELKTAADVDRELAAQQGTAMVIVNSVCGCAAGRMRPAVRIALENRAR